MSRSHQPASVLDPADPSTEMESHDFADRSARVAISQLEESPLNPRKHFDDEKLKELADSVRTRGIVQPLIVRQVDAGSHHPMRYEIVAGARRFRAAQLAGLETVPVIIRLYSDADVRDLGLVENIQRDDLTPLERATAFRHLLTSNPDKHSAEAIGRRVGKAATWVWDQIKLLDLIDEIKGLLEEGRITEGHAVPIARLKPADQRRVLLWKKKPYGNGGESILWEIDEASLPWDRHAPPQKGRKAIPYDGLKPKSRRELERGIARHIRFDVEHAAKAVPLQFEPLRDAVEAAVAKPGRGRKVVAITFETFTAPDARDESDRTYGPSAWKRADGTIGTTNLGYPSFRCVDSPACDHVVLGIVAAGVHQGDHFDICMARDKCETHWAKEIKERAKAQRQSGPARTATLDRREATRLAKEQREIVKRQAREARWAAFAPALTKAVMAAAAKMPAKLPRPLFQKVVAGFKLPSKTTPATLQKALLDDYLDSTFNRKLWINDERFLVEWAKALGVNVKALEPAKSKTPAAAKEA